MATLQTKIAEIELSLWYSLNRNLGKLGLQRDPSAGRFCKPCNSSTHWESSCWGTCLTCSKQGHKTRWCHHAAKEGVPPVTPESAKARIEKKKKKKTKKATKAIDPPGAESPASSGSNSASEVDSPTRTVVLCPSSSQNPWSSRVNLGSTNKAVYKGDLNTKLSNISKEEVVEAFQALRAIRDDSPMTNTRLFEELWIMG